MKMIGRRGLNKRWGREGIFPHTLSLPFPISCSFLISGNEILLGNQGSGNSAHMFVAVNKNGGTSAYSSRNERINQK